jgi:hypothetical protein
MSDLQTRLQRAAEEAAHLGRPPGPGAAIRRGRQRRRRLLGGTASLVALVLLAGALGTGRLATRQTPLAPAPTTTSVIHNPEAVKKVVPLNYQIHFGPAGFPDRWGMARDLTSQMKQCEGGTAQVRMWAQVLGQTWALAAKEPLPGKNWICWSDGLWNKDGGNLYGGHGGSKNRLKPLQASMVSDNMGDKGTLVVVSGPVTRQANRLEILFRNGLRIDIMPVELGPQFPVKFYAVPYHLPVKKAWMPSRVVAYNQAGRKIAECWSTTGPGNACDRALGVP